MKVNNDDGLDDADNSYENYSKKTDNNNNFTKFRVILAKS